MINILWHLLFPYRISEPFQRKCKDILLHYQDTVITLKKCNVATVLANVWFILTFMRLLQFLAVSF